MPGDSPSGSHSATGTLLGRASLTLHQDPLEEVASRARPQVLGWCMNGTERRKGPPLDHEGRDRGSASSVWSFFFVTYAFSWICWGIAYLMARGTTGATGATEDLLANAPPALLVLVLLGVFGPFVSAFVLTGRELGRTGVATLWKSGWNVRIPGRSWVVAVGFFPVVWVTALLVSGSGVSLELLTAPLSLVGLALFMYFLGGPFGEEFGWRGYALPRLLDQFGPRVASAVVGVFWIGWHLPLFVIPGSPQAQIPFVGWAVQVMGMAFLFTWLHLRTGGVVFAAILFHTMSNFSTDLFRVASETTGQGPTPQLLNATLIVFTAIVLARTKTFRIRGNEESVGTPA